MTPPEADRAREPWPGYADESREERAAKLKFKVQEARGRGDRLYAQAVAAAVANYEALQREGDERSETEDEARAHFDDVGGWGH